MHGLDSPLFGPAAADDDNDNDLYNIVLAWVNIRTCRKLNQNNAADEHASYYSKQLTAVEDWTVS